MDEKQILIVNGCSLRFWEEQPDMKVNFIINSSCKTVLYSTAYKCILLFILLICTSDDLSAQCSGNLYDSGGSSGNYSNNENITAVLDATPGKLMHLSFNSFNVEAGYDFLYVYDGPDVDATLLGTYSGTTLPPDITSTGQYLTLHFTSDNIVTRPGFSIALSCVDPPSVPDCLVIAESNNGQIYSWVSSPADNTLIGTLNALNVESMALSFDGQTIYATDEETFGTIDHITGAFTPMATVGSGDGYIGVINMTDIDGLAINPNNGLIMATHRRNSDNDILFVINPETGTIEKNYFGPGIDYREIIGAQQDMDDIAFHPTTDELFGISTVSSSSTNDQIVLIDQYLGSVTPVSTLPTCDIEGLTFNDAGVLYGSSGFEECAPYTSNTIYEIDYSDINGSVTAITTIPSDDTEAIVCFVSAIEPCNDIVSGGNIGSYQEVCFGDDVLPFTNVTNANSSAGSTIEYQWYYSTTSCIAPLNNDPQWVAISGANSLTYDHGVLFEKTCFVRGARTLGCPEFVKFSNVVTVDVSPCSCPSPIAVNYAITTGNDDVEERDDGSMYMNSSDIEMIFEGDPQTVGLRFNNINVPSYANVQSAKLVFKADETDLGPVTLFIQGELIADSPPFTTSNGNVTSRTRTVSTTTWSDVESWTKGNIYTSSDFSDVIHEIIQQGSWTPGNSISIIISGGGQRIAESYDKSNGTPIELHIDYCDVEVCGNDIDDDGDGYVDSFDPDCPNYAPYDCDKTLYQSMSPDNGTTYYLEEINTDPLSFTQLYDLTARGVTSSGFNSIAFNPIDRFIYGINPLKTGNYEMYMINDLGEVQYKGNITGLTGTNEAGCMAPDGTYYVTGSSNKLFEINTSTLVATQIVDLGFEAGDIAYNPSDNLIYAWNSDANQLYQIVPSTGASSSVGSPNNQYASFGSMFFDEQGNLFAYGDDTNISGTVQETFVSINTLNGTITNIGTSTEREQNDGCSCAYGVGLAKAASLPSIEPGDPLSYTFTIYNRTGSPLTNVTFEDILPSGLTFSSNPYNITGISMGSPSIVGSNSANFVISNIPLGSSNSFTVDINVPVDFCDDISNQASLQNLGSQFGSTVLSDDPDSAKPNDATYTIVGNCEEYWLESECEDVGANWNIVTDPTASRDNYATISPGFNSLNSPPTGVDDRIRFNVTITNAGDYNVFGRVHAPSGNDDSFWVRANGGTWYKWNTLSSFASGGWEWGQVYNSDAGNSIVTFPLVAGANTIDFAYREDGTQLDKIKVALSDELPTGEGGISMNCPEICDNGLDDDGDGLTDCEDDDCNSEVYCQGPCDPGKLFVERWFGIPGSSITDLTSHPDYPNSPSELDYISLFQGPNNYADNYGTRVRGFVIPSEDGTYTFNVTGDDNTVLYLSTDVDDVNKTEIASVTGFSGVTEHNKYTVQTSADIELKAGVWYYVELLVKEGTGGDHFQVYWKTPSVPGSWNIIPGANLAPYICPEICDNGLDDDGDGLADCLDPDCENGVNVYITSTDNVICVGETAVLNAEYLGNPGTLTYAWSGGAGTNQVANVSPATTTTYVVTVTNTSGCTATDQMVVTVNSLPNAGASNDGTLTCTNNSVIMTATPAGMSYAWSGGGSGQTKTVTTAGTYTVTVTDGNGCTNTANTTVNEDLAPPNADAGLDQAICIGESATLTATGGGTYEWEDSSTSNTRIVSPVVTTDYVVTVTAANGCTDIDTVRVVVNPLPNPTITKDGDIQCDNPSVELTALPAGLSYAWSTTESSQIINVTTSGTFTVTVTDGNGCTNTANIVVDEYLTPTTIFCERYRIREYGSWGSWIDFSGICEIEICENDGLTDIEIDGGPDLNTGWVWTDESNNPESEVDEIVMFEDIDLSDDGTYTGEYTNAYGCVSTINIDVIVNANPVASASNDGPITCTLPTVTMTALPAGQSYSWQGGGTGQTKTTTVPGTYAVTVTNAEGCTDVASTIVTEDTTPPVANAGLDQEICNGDSTTLTATGVGTFQWSGGHGTNPTITVSPVVTTTYIVTVTATNGCQDVDSVLVTVNALPVASASNDGPITCTLPNVTMTALPAGMSYQWQGGGTNQTKIVSAAGTYSVTVTDVNGCTDVASTTVTDDLAPPVATAESDDLICEGDSIDLIATGSGTYLWSHGAGNTDTVTVSPTVTTTYTVTVTAANGCQDTANVTITVDPKPIVSITGSDTICVQTSTSLSPSTGGTWQSSDNSIAIVSSSGTVVGLSPGTASFIFTSSTTGCQSDPTADVTITEDLTVGIDFVGGICIDDDSQLSANVTGGTMDFTYNWTGPSGFTASTQVVDIYLSGNYYVTVTDVAGCEDATSAYVYEAYDPFIFTLNTEICEDEEVTLSVNSSSAVAYQWGANAGNATTQSVTVTPGVPSEDYFVTVTNDIGCTTEATVHIDVKPKTPVTVSGSDEICIGETTNLTPATGGYWTSSNNSIAGVTNDGTVTGLSPGTVSFSFMDTTSNCESNPTLPVTVLERPTVNVSGPDVICEGDITNLTPTSGGSWVSNDPALATVTNGGLVTALDEGSVSFTFTDSLTGCASEATTDITIYPIYTTNFTGPDSICQDENTYLTPTSGGTWTSSDSTIATVTNIGVVTGLSPGNVTFTFTSDYSCVSGATSPLTVIAKDVISISGDNEVCEDETITLTASSPGGTWSSSNTSIASVDTSGNVTGISSGSAVITYTHDPNNCETDPIMSITVKEKPTVNLSGPAEICAGEVTVVTTSGSGGIWSSSDESVAIVSIDGTVVGMSAGTATFTYTSSNACESDETLAVTVNPAIDVSIEYIGSPCLEVDSKITAAITGGVPGFTYSWSGPGGFSSNQDTIDVTLSGSYNVLVTDGAGCSSNTTAYVYEAYNPFVFTLDTEICEGEDITLSVNGSSGGTYQWSANAGSATTQSVTVTPSVPGDTYYVTITSPQGCTTVADAIITVEALPVVNITGTDSLCIGGTTNLTPTTGGLWSSSNYSVASVSNSGVVSALAAGTVTFTFRDTSTGCYSAPTTDVTVSPNDNILINGDNDICMGIPETLTASVPGGTWSSTNTGVATVNSSGEVTPVSAGSADILYTPVSNSCYNIASRTVNVNNIPTVNINGPSTICEGEITYLVPSNGGTWVSSDTTIATVSNIGIVTGVSGGSATFTFTSVAGCVQTLSTPITIVDEPVVSITGPSSICKDETTTLSPTSGGIWISSNTIVATVNSSGLVIGKNPGTAQFTFVELENGCSSSDLIEVTVHPVPSISGFGSSELCIGETTNISPSTGGTWSSSDTTVATISSAGLISAVGAGAVSFTYTDNITGCPSNPSGNLIVNGNPSINTNGATELCVEEQSSMLPSSGGTWSTSDVSVATITNGGIVSGVSAGTVTFTFTSNNTGCQSSPSEIFTVNNPSTASISGTSSMCIGSTSMVTGSVSGTWESSNEAIATVNNSGVVTANGPGVVTITLVTTAECITNPTFDILVNPKPNPVFTGPSAICIGSTTTLGPSSGGIWMSNDTTIAIVDSLGNVTSISSGVVSFVLTDNSTGCSATTSTLLTVYNEPIIDISGSDEICIGEVTNMLPSSGGQWVSSDNNIATIDPSGQVTGISEGVVNFTYIENNTSCSSVASDNITILPKPTASITGPSNLCIGNTSTLSPTSGGSWISSNTSAATVTDQGVVSAVGQGVAKFTFVSDAGCSSNQTAPIVVNGIPTVTIDGPSELCEGETVSMLPSSGGTWTSNAPSIATIANDGLVTTLSAGTVTFMYTDTSTGCVSLDSEVLTVNSIPVTGLNGPDSICIGTTTNFTPTAGGVWTSVNPSIATIENNGDVTGISTGTTQFIFTHLGTGCVSDTTTAITVTSEATPVFIGSNDICIGDTTYISPSVGGTWESTNPAVATITNSGMIIGVGQGTSKFRFTNSTTGCVSTLSSSLVVNGIPTVFVDGNDIICVATSTTLSPSAGGSWTSLNPSIATVTSNGLVTGVAEGTAYFIFQDSITGCSSNGNLSIEVEDVAPITISGETDVCIGYTIQLNPSTGGFWQSSNSAIAKVSNSGLVTGKAPGKVTFTFTDLSNNCVNENISDSITVLSCKNHDFNVAVVNQEIFGNISTNDNFPEVATYSNNKQLISKPQSSTVIFNINSDGSYSFQANKPGNYRYRIPICLDPYYTGCPTTLIEITLVDKQYSTGNPVANLDIATIFGIEGANKSGSAPGTFEINTDQNDVCIYTLGCNMDWSTAWLQNAPSNGFSEIKPAGIMEYTPDVGFIGFDTIYYGICADGFANCNTSMQIITVNHASAVNSVVASDDFIWTLRGNAISGNVMLNDSDAEGDEITVTPQGSLMAPVVTSAGEYYIDSLGVFSFTPNDSFSGHTEIIYEVCDDNGNQACMEATLHLLVFDDISVKLRAYLQGALMQNGGATSAQGLPLMRDDLRVSPFTGLNYIPLMDPYTISADPWAGTPSKFNKLGPGLLAENIEIMDSLGVFGVSGDNAIVDWVHVELRSKDDMTVPIATRSGLIQRDGDIVDLDGVSNLRFNAVNVDSFYVVVKHRSHLGVMSQKVAHTDIVDFTSPSFPIYNFGVQGLNDYTGLSQNDQVKSGYMALWAGDFDSNGKVKFTNPGDDQNVLFVDVLFSSPDFLINFDQAYGYMTGDFNMNSKTKYTNPSDDTNYLFSQILLYPLNNSYLSNYNSLIEQIPND